MNSLILTAILGLLLGAILFLCTIKAYCIGLKHGKQQSQGITPTINLNPVKAIVDVVEQHQEKKETAKAEEELTDIMSYSKESALEAIKKEKVR